MRALQELVTAAGNETVSDFPIIHGNFEIIRNLCNIQNLFRCILVDDRYKGP